MIVLIKSNIMDVNLFQQQIAEVKVSYSHKVKLADRAKVTGSHSVVNYVRPLWEDIDYRESFAILLLSRAMDILGINWISKGGVSGTVVDAKTIFQAALKTNSSAILLLHNHPSGILQPSNADIQITNKIKEGGKYLDISVPDHIIITSDGYYSCADEGDM